jgi:hypothetical protein
MPASIWCCLASRSWQSHAVTIELTTAHGFHVLQHMVGKQASTLHLGRSALSLLQNFLPLSVVNATARPKVSCETEISKPSIVPDFEHLSLEEPIAGRWIGLRSVAYQEDLADSEVDGTDLRLCKPTPLSL